MCVSEATLDLSEFLAARTCASCWLNKVLALTRALRARRARPPEVAEKLCSARAACVSTWLGEGNAREAMTVGCKPTNFSV